MSGVPILKFMILAEELFCYVLRVKPKITRVGTHHIARMTFQGHMSEIPDLERLKNSRAYAQLSMDLFKRKAPSATRLG
jgi:hypothetical protein